MLTLEKDTLVFRFPEVHEQARTSIDLQITLRIPDDTKEYPLPPGLGSFPLRHTEDFGNRVPEQWRMRGGVMLPMFATEAMWLSFAHDEGDYPCAIKIAGGKINAVSGKAWKPELDAAEHDYIVSPPQPWLDGFAVGKGQIRQFVAMPLGGGFTAEEQLTGKAEWGGLQIIVYPMKRERWLELEVERQRKARERLEMIAREAAAESAQVSPKKMMLCDPFDGMASCAPAAMAEDCGVNFAFSPKASLARVKSVVVERKTKSAAAPPASPVAMGLGAGGRMRQEIYKDPYGIDAWDQSVSSRCFLTLVEARDWQRITGEDMRRMPPTPRVYEDYGLPWFDYDAPGQAALPGAPELTMLKTVGEVAEAKGLDPLSDNESVDPKVLVKLGPAQGA